MKFIKSFLYVASNYRPLLENLVGERELSHECAHCKRYVHYLARSQCLHYFIQCCNKPGSIIASICTMQNNSFLDILAQIFILHQSCSRPRPLGHYGAVLRRALSLARYCTLNFTLLPDSNLSEEKEC